jgi:hypothetical protein
MPDITMCRPSGQECKQRDKCHRFTAKADKYQSMCDFTDSWIDGECGHFWSNVVKPMTESEQADLLCKMWG